MTRRVRIGAALGAAVLLLAGAVLAVILTRGGGGGSTPPTQTLVTTEDLAKLRTEAEAAARNLFAKIDEADATGNPAVLDGLYTEGAKALEDGQKKSVTKRSAQGLISVHHGSVTDLRVEDLTPRIASVRLVLKVPFSEIREAKSRKLVKRTPGATVPVQLNFERIDGRWLVAKLRTEDSG